VKGFDERWKDFPDYILGVTKEIWEDRNIAALKQYYADSIYVRSPASFVKGNRDVIGATMATLNEFPDRRLLGEDVIWCGTPETGMLSSHRLLSTATHLGEGVYGEATGKQVRCRILADCHAINNQINDEWLVRDQGAIVRQMGWDAKQYAVDLIEREGGPEACVQPFHPDLDEQGPYRGRGNDSVWGNAFAHILSEIMDANLAIIPQHYDRAVTGYFPGGQELSSTDGVDSFWMGLRAAFPSATFQIEHLMGREDPLMPARAALRWSLTGKHDGWGVFGRPTGAEVHVMGISHAEFGPWGLRREYTLFDETAIWKQIALKTG
jgi:predicted ester cyclase